MAKQNILLGGVVKEEVAKANSNFDELYQAVDGKVDKQTGKDLSSNDYTNSDKAKVEKLGKIDFTVSDFGTAQDDGYFYATVSAAGKYPVKVMKSNGSNYEEVIAQTSVEGDNIVICSAVAFAGYVVTL